MNFKPQFFYDADKGDGGTTPSGGDQGTDYKALYEKEKAAHAETTKRWTGQQTVTNTALEAQKAAETKLAEITGQYQSTQAELTNIRKAHDTLQTGVSSLTEQKTAYEKQIQDLTKGKERLDILVGYPDLLSWEKDGLLPKDLYGDELKAALDKIAGRVSKQKAADGEGEADGFSPTPPNGAKPKTPDEIMVAANEAARQGNTTEYNKLMTQYYAAGPKVAPVVDVVNKPVNGKS